MAIYKLFAEKDATIYSDYPTMNTGADAILELNSYPSILYSGTASVDRILIKFSTDELNEVFYSKIQSSSYSASLRLFLADAEAISDCYTIEAFPISESWEMGVGRYMTIPINQSGVTWQSRKANNSALWQTITLNSGVTQSSNDLNPGGGNWYYNYRCTQSFSHYEDKDINMDITPIISSYMSGSIYNTGIILKNTDDVEFNPNTIFKLNFFSRDTNTIYPPLLELKWDDSYFNVTTASIYTLVTSPDIKVSLKNNKAEYSCEEVARFRLNVRDQYPVRVFSTSSIYNMPKYLPSSSYYSIKDVKTDLSVVDFDYSYTKISADDGGNYFDIYMNGLEPERYYKVIIQTEISGSVIVFDNQAYFKVVE